MESKRAISLIETLVGVAILAVVAVPFFSLLRTSVRSVERTQDHIIAYSLLEKISENLRQRLVTPENRDKAIELEVDNTPVTDFIKADEDFNADGTIDDWAQMASLAKGSPDDVDYLSRMMNRFHVTIKNEWPSQAADGIVADKNDPTRVAGITKKVFIAWKTLDNKDRFVSMDVFQPIYANYMSITKEGYADSPLFYGGMLAAAINRGYRTGLKLAKAREEAATALTPPADYVFNSNEYWPTDQTSMLIRGNTRVNVKLVLLEKSLGISKEDLSNWNDLEHGGTTLGTVDRTIEREVVAEALGGIERGQGRHSNNFLVALDSMKLKCVSCHSRYFFKTDPQLRAHADKFLPVEHMGNPQAFGGKDGPYSGRTSLAEAQVWAARFNKAGRWVNPETGEAYVHSELDSMSNEEMDQRFKNGK